MTELDEFRQEKDRFFGSHPQSPLTPEQRRSFQGLRYYSENPALRLRLPLDTDVPHDVIVMETSTGDQQTYARAGKVSFTVDGREVALYLYAAEDAHQLFLPFRDATSGTETYGAGRYLEVEAREDGTVVVDFNYAYNPYCAYNEQWSCPIPPVENWLRAPIRAGEMTFDQKGHP